MQNTETLLKRGTRIEVSLLPDKYTQVTISIFCQHARMAQLRSKAGLWQNLAVAAAFPWHRAAVQYSWSPLLPSTPKLLLCRKDLQATTGCQPCFRSWMFFLWGPMNLFNVFLYSRTGWQKDEECAHGKLPNLVVKVLLRVLGRTPLRWQEQPEPFSMF